MSLYRRKDSPYWWVKVVVGGRKVQRSAETSDRKKAQQFETALKAELWQQQKLGVKPRRSWMEAATKYLVEATHKTLDTDRHHLVWLGQFLERVMLDEITRSMLCTIQQVGRAEGVSNATVNRRLQVVSRILRKARDEWEWIDAAPKVPVLSEPLERVRFLTVAEAQCLLCELPEHLATMADFTIQTGLRMSNVTGLRWDRVDLVRRRLWVVADEAKGRRGIHVPLNDRAVEILRQERMRHPTHVFTYLGKPVLRPNQRAWRHALKRAGIENFHWHDLRHTWATWHVQNGTPLHVLQKLGGWRSIDMVLRYAHLTDEHLAGFADNVNGSGSIRSNGASGYISAT